MIHNSVEAWPHRGYNPQAHPKVARRVTRSMVKWGLTDEELGTNTTDEVRSSHVGRLVPDTTDTANKAEETNSFSTSATRLKFEEGENDRVLASATTAMPNNSTEKTSYTAIILDSADSNFQPSATIHIVGQDDVQINLDHYSSNYSSLNGTTGFESEHQHITKPNPEPSTTPLNLEQDDVSPTLDHHSGNHSTGVEATVSCSQDQLLANPIIQPPTTPNIHTHSDVQPGLDHLLNNHSGFTGTSVPLGQNQIVTDLIRSPTIPNICTYAEVQPNLNPYLSEPLSLNNFSHTEGTELQPKLNPYPSGDLSLIGSVVAQHERNASLFPQIPTALNIDAHDSDQPDLDHHTKTSDWFTDTRVFNNEHQNITTLQEPREASEKYLETEDHLSPQPSKSNFHILLHHPSKQALSLPIALHCSSTKLCPVCILVEGSSAVLRTRFSLVPETHEE